jgi:hypothetical protein
MRVYYGAIVQRSGDEWIAISRESATPGEKLVLDVDEGEQQHRFTVQVIESRPVIVDGDVRHRLRLRAGELPPALFEPQVRRG